MLRQLSDKQTDGYTLLEPWREVCTVNSNLGIRDTVNTRTHRNDKVTGKRLQETRAEVLGHGTENYRLEATRGGTL